DGRKPATQALGQFEQFSNALGTLLGKPDLRLDPPLRIIVFKNQQELQAQCGGPASSAGLRTGRDRLMACTTAEGQLPAGLLKELTHTLLENNFPAMSGEIENGLRTFFSTVQSNGVHVTWGAPPPASERTREWALLHLIITQPDYSAKAKIFLHNLAAGMEKSAASRNAFAEDGPKFEAEVDRYYAAGVFNTAVAPSRALNPDRDFSTSALTSDEGELMHADLLTPASEALYLSLLKSGKHIAEDNEGLAVLAMRAGDTSKAASYIGAAREAGTKNFVALTAYASLDKDSAEATDILKEALTIDPKYALAHWVFGEKVREADRRMAEWKQAVALAPRNSEWAAKYAQLCLDEKQYAEAGRAWMAAAQAAPDAATREHYLSLRSQIESQRLDAEEAQRREDAAVKANEIEELKTKARKDLAALEARANNRPLSADPVRPTVDWYDTDSEAKLTGMLVRVNCTGKQLRLEVKDDHGKTEAILISDPTQLVVQGGDGKLSCGAQKPVRVTVAYRKPKDAKGGVIGEATGIEFNP
ncbi:MAG TPA: hypothetical protein VG273_07805, partial [Bryobacteraceae bacterium]|nr:hypothetical protein [Bryobacteraceae bacterium]